MADPKYEYRWTWKREPHAVFKIPTVKKTRIYQTLRGALQFGEIFGDYPWRAKYPDAHGDDPECCSGYECTCQGITLRESHNLKDWAPLEYAKLERREVGAWGAVESDTTSQAE